MALKIKLEEWLKREFDPPPALRTARRWIKDQKIYPPAIKVGNAYYIEQGSIFIGDKDTSAVKAAAGLRLAQRIPQ